MEMWSQTDALGYTATVTFDGKEYTVSVVNKEIDPEGFYTLTESFTCFYEPIFGMDIEDLETSKQIACMLADQLEGILENAV